MPTPTRSPLVLNGFMGAGKSTIGRIVAERTGSSFVDLDASIERAAGMSIPSLFRERGEAGFRALEAAALEKALSAIGSQVIAVGGGALLDRRTRRDVLARATVVTLTAKPEVLLARTGGADRPLLEGTSDRQGRIVELLEARKSAYAEAHAQIATDARSPSAVADAVIAAWSTPTIPVPLGDRSYSVRLVEKSDGPRLLAEMVAALAPTTVFLVTDETVRDIAAEAVLAALSASGLRVGAVVALVPGEASKQLSCLETTMSAMIRGGADRDSVVVALGGGVVSDLAGFAAATLLRGVRWVVAPTTLLAMVDASVGGKTAVDVGPAKNSAGAFHQPSAVFINSSYVTTESRRAYVSGLAEVVKTAAIGDAELFVRLEAEAEGVLRRDADVVLHMILRSIAVKAGIVSRDERESGERALLNFGHTIGHALEADGGYERLTHGESVSLGMIAALRLGRHLGVTPPEAADRVERLLVNLGLPTDLDAQPLKRALSLLGLDKKRSGSRVRAILLRDVGAPVMQWIELADLRRAFGA